MKRLSKILAAAGCALLPFAASADRLDPTDPNDVIKMQIKQNCSLKEGEDTVYWWSGKMYSRRPGERDRHLFNVQGMNVRACDILEDPDKGMGYRSVSREVMFYLDPETNEVVDTWVNPWTGEEVNLHNNSMINFCPIHMGIRRFLPSAAVFPCKRRPVWGLLLPRQTPSPTLLPDRRPA